MPKRRDEQEDGSEAWVPIDWPAVMPRTLWDVAQDFGLLVRDRGLGPRIALAERARGETPVALRYRRIPGPIGSSGLALGALTSWKQPTTDPAIREFGRTEIERRLTDGSLASRLSALQLDFATAGAAELPEVLNRYFTERLPELAGGSVFLVEAAHHLHYSMVSIARMLVRAVEYPGIIGAASSNPALLEGGMGLTSGDVLGGGSFLMPAVSATSPFQLGMVAHRGAGSLVVLYPEPIRSPENRLPTSLAGLHEPRFFTSARVAATVVGRAERGDSDSFLVWWLDRWNRLLAELLDPATHRSRSGLFDAHLMLGRYLTVQRLLACLQSILVSAGVEEFTRVELLFEALDLMDNLGWHMGSWEQMATPGNVESRLVAVKAALAGEPEVERVVMERCERAVEALTALRSGFRDGKARDDRQTDKAVFTFLRSLRNAGHGLNQSQDSREALKNLMGHVAYVPPDLPELIWFHIVAALCFATWRYRRGR